jgi:signal transduction histidine kinase
MWDPTRLERVIANLLNNAVKYSPEGGDIELSLSRQEGDGEMCAVLRVRDHGIGVPAADLPHIFERFRRAGNVEGRISGTGLGLASARHIVEQHGGVISVESREGEGALFTVRLPVAEGKQDE